MRCTWPRSPGRRWRSPSSTGCRGMPPFSWRSGIAAFASRRSTCRRPTTSPSAPWRWWRSRSARRSRNGRTRRWRWRRRAGSGWGNPNGIEAIRRAGMGGAPLRAAIAKNADRHARDLVSGVEDIRSGGSKSLRAIAVRGETIYGSLLRSACRCTSCAALSWERVNMSAWAARSPPSSQRLRQIPRMPSSGWPTTRDENDLKVIGPA